MLAVFRKHKLFALIYFYLPVISLSGLIDTFIPVYESMLLIKSLTTILELLSLWQLNYAIIKRHFNLYRVVLILTGIILIILAVVDIISSIYRNLFNDGIRLDNLSVFIFGALACLLLATKHGFGNTKSRNILISANTVDE
jgi:hypothetical protein